MDAVTLVMRSFRCAVLEESTGKLLDIGALPQDAELYSRHNARISDVISTHHKMETIRKVLDYAPSRPVVRAYQLDLSTTAATAALLPILCGFGVNIVFWRLDMVAELSRVARVLAGQIEEGGTVYVYNVDRCMARQRALEGDMILYPDSVRLPDGEKRMFPSCSTSDIDAAFTTRGFRLIFREYLDNTAHRLCMNLLPHEKIVCSLHLLSAFSVPMHI